MCVIEQLFYDKNMFEREKTITEKSWQNILDDKTILS